jgi:GNAT superfamily N-acetyltransferase
MSILARFNSLPPGGIDPALILAPGTAKDFHALSRFHYRAAPPATTCLVLTLRDADGPIACLVVSRPTLNSWWRPLAWPDLVRPTPTAAAQALNHHVRTISRVIVDPRYRGIGLALRLVRAYLDDPLTDSTEALAAMGRACPFFARAGMTAHHRPRTARDLKLLRAVKDMDLPPGALLEPPRRLRAALRSWANDARATRHLIDQAIARAAARAILAPPIAYTHGPPGRGTAARGDPWSSRSNPSAPLTTCTASSRGSLPSPSREPV